tara:strand:+ start:181 stop:792 length:612 start_codon:yes stop_codon:yes gene_type:complete
LTRRERNREFQLRLIGGKKIQSPKSILTRPTTLMVREALFNILGESLKNSYWLDLFSGSGALSCEAYNHGAKKIVAIEKNRKNAHICLKNLLTLENAIERTNDFEVICRDVISWIKPANQKINPCKIINLNKHKFDFIYLDPPYKAEYYDLLIKQIFESNLIKETSQVICEHSKHKLLSENSKFKIKDIRSYGQTKLTFLIKI